MNTDRPVVKTWLTRQALWTRNQFYEKRLMSSFTSCLNSLHLFNSYYPLHPLHLFIHFVSSSTSSLHPLHLFILSPILFLLHHRPTPRRLRMGGIGVCVGLFSCWPKRQREGRGIHKRRRSCYESDCYTRFFDTRYPRHNTRYCTLIQDCSRREKKQEIRC